MSDNPQDAMFITAGNESAIVTIREVRDSIRVRAKRILCPANVYWGSALTQGKTSRSPQVNLTPRIVWHSRPPYFDFWNLYLIRLCHLICIHDVQRCLIVTRLLRYVLSFDIEWTILSSLRLLVAGRTAASVCKRLYFFPFKLEPLQMARQCSIYWLQ